MSAQMSAQPEAIEFNIRIAFTLKEEGDWVIASCPALDVHSQGKDAEEAAKNLSEAVSLFVQSCYERGSLGQVMKDCGFSSTRERDNQLGLSAQGRVLDIPLYLLSDRNAAAQAC